MKRCAVSHQHFLERDCPHCVLSVSMNQHKISIALLLGIGLMGCGGREEETGESEPIEEAGDDSAVEAMYGVPE